MRATDTIAAIATPPGKGGVGIVRISGNNLDAFIAGICGEKPLDRYAVFTPFLDGARQVIDEGIALYFTAPRSYTGEHVLELHGHGGNAVMRALLARCVELGARIAEPGEFTKRAFLNDKLDLAQAEAVADLINASTHTAARAAARSLTGEFSRRVNHLVEELINIRVHIEATFDFPEEELDGILGNAVQNRITQLRCDLDTFCRNARIGAMLREGLTVALIGAPNVGKSSLLNYLAQEEAAIVTPEAGTTRDTIERQIAVAGIPLTIIDTAGLRDAESAVEKIGITRTWATIDRADIALLLLDIHDTGHEISDENIAILKRLPEAMPRILVYNKTDLLSADALTAARQNINTSYNQLICAGIVLISAKTGAGIPELESLMLRCVHAAPATENTFLARERHVAALTRALEELNDAKAVLHQERPLPELAAEHLRRAQEALAQITGAFSADDLLGEIFSRFCIGK